MTNASFTEREEQIVERVEEACGGLTLEASVVDVHKLDGGIMPTLRFTLLGQASTDLERPRIAEGGESPEELARIVFEELKRQVEMSATDQDASPSSPA